MSKAVLISIQPKWCELIANGKKTIEVRKTRPKIKTPFKCYIYCTLQGSNEFFKHTLNGSISKWNEENWGFKKGKVIGEFVCDTFVTDLTFGHDPLFNGAACMSEVEATAYSCQSPIYGWHISDLVIYGKPKELSEFYRECGGVDDTGLCYECDKAVGEECDCGLHYELHLTRPPQSWCYVEEREDNGST